mgnify:CR=1 FL=1
MQSHAMHNLVHDKGSTCHVSRIFEERNKEIYMSSAYFKSSELYEKAKTYLTSEVEKRWEMILNQKM